MGAMSLSVDALKAALRGRDDRHAAIAIEFLRRDDLEDWPLPQGISGEVLVRGITPTWTARADLNESKGNDMPGLSQFAKVLQQLPPDTVLEYQAFRAGRQVGQFWTDRTQALVGFVIPKLRSLEEEAARLERFRKHCT
jgi:hypothetical protein